MTSGDGLSDRCDAGETERDRRNRILDGALSCGRDRGSGGGGGRRRPSKGSDNRRGSKGNDGGGGGRNFSRSRSRSPRRGGGGGGGRRRRTDRDDGGRRRDDRKDRTPRDDDDERNRGRRPEPDDGSNGRLAHPSRRPTASSHPRDERLGDVDDDPRNPDPSLRITQKASVRGAGRNTESFDPSSTLVRPDLRVVVGSGSDRTYRRPLKHDDVVIVPELFGKEDDWTLYYKLVEEMREVQSRGVKGSEWIPWHEGAHLISKNPKGSKTFEEVVDRLCEYFNVRKESIGTRFNWYKDSSDWKPFHHDSAAFNPQRAKNQNITVGVSFGAMRELAFVRAKPYDDGDKCKLYFPQTNNGVFSFGRDANILWKHGVNALPPSEQYGKGRISIILWGLAGDAIEEEGSPSLLGSDGRGPHAQRDHHRRHRRNGNGDSRRGGGNDNGGHGRKNGVKGRGGGGQRQSGE